MTRHRHLLAVLLLLLFGVTLPGCASPSASSSPSSSSDAGFPLTITDDAGRQVTIENPPQRIISLAPSNTEILFALGLGSRVVGVTTYCNYPEEARQCHQIGGFSNPNIERIVDLRPDLVVAADRHLKEAQVLEQMGIDVIVIDARRTSEISRSIRFIGQACGVSEAAEKLASDIDQHLEAVKALVAGTSQQPRVFYQVFNEPLTTAGPTTIISDLITVCGGINIAADTSTDYPQISEEAVVDRNPEVIIQSSQHGSQQADASLYGQQWNSVSAIQNNRIYVVDGDICTRGGPRIIEALDIFLACIHPELVADTNLPGTTTPGTATPGTATPGTATPGTATPGTAVPDAEGR